MANKNPSKRQRELLNFIDEFIKEHGYSPSYREIMRALNYKSVSTVAVHIDGLITRGFLEKREHSARSLEVVKSNNKEPATVEANHLEWLRQEITRRESSGAPVGEIEVLKSALALLDQA